MGNAAASKSRLKSPAVSQSSSDDDGCTTDTGLPGRLHVRNLLFLSILFHILLIPSIFDIYFTSPVVNVDQWFSVENLQPQVDLDGRPRHLQDVAPTRLAKRVVVMVGDGLRADKLFQLYPDPPFHNLDPLPPPLDTLSTRYAEARQKTVRHAGKTSPAPFLRGLIEEGIATWGVSHTRVPTESRPGHVSLLAGMYEDPSAVLKGWQHNPVEFDSVFNRSSYSYMFGSPDIIPIFVDGARPEGKVHGWTYGGQEEDFTADAVHLDVWVLDRLRELLKNSSSPAYPNLDAQLRSSGTVFFLHLLGLDTTGHAYRPHGPEYYRNIQAVDVIAETVQKEFETFFGDKDTAYIFSADHGMSSRGNHGDGHPDNTRTPLVAWGAGVPPAGPRGNWSQAEDDEADWALSAYARNDVEQAQIAPLISILAGNAIPGNNVGLLPSPYIQGSLEFRGLANLAVAREVCQQYSVKEAYRRAHSLLYWPCPGLSHLELKQKMEQLDYLARAHRYARLSLEASMLAIKALDGLKYLQRYDWLILRCVVVVAYMSWMAYCLLFVLRTYTTTLKGVETRSSRLLHIASAGVVALVSARFIVQRSPMTYYVYLAFPAYFTFRLCQDVDAMALVWKKLLRPNWPYAIPLLVGVEGMVLGYFQRRAWTAGYLFIGTLWPLASLRKKVSNRFLLSWAVLSCLTGLFTTLSVDRESDIRLVVAGSALFLLASTAHQISKTGGGSSAIIKQIGAIQTVLLLATTVVTVRSEKHLTEKLGLPLFFKMLGWILLVLSSATVCFAPNNHNVTFQTQAVAAIMAFAPTFVILSLSYETLFFFCFSASLVLWYELETRVSVADQQAAAQGSKPTQAEKTLTARHMRIAVFFLFFIHFGFFGPQNVASIASFYLDAGNVTAGSATETDNETEEIDTWGELVDSGFNAVPIASGSVSRSTHKRRNTLSAAPWMALSALFGKAQPSPPSGQSFNGVSGLMTPTSAGGRFGAVLFRRASRTTRRNTDDTLQPKSPDPTASRGFLPDSTSTATIVPASSAQPSLIPRLRAPFVRNTSTRTDTTDVSSNTPSSIFGGSSSPSASATHRYFENPQSAQHTVRARQLTSPNLSPVSDSAHYYYDEVADPPQRSRIAKSSGNSVTSDLSNTSSAAPFRLSYQSALSDRHVFAGRGPFPGSSQGGHHSLATRSESPTDFLEAVSTTRPGSDAYLRDTISRREASPSPERSTTSLVSQQSAITYTSGLSDCGNASNAALSTTATRRKLKKKTRPQIATSQLPDPSTSTQIPASNTRRYSPIHHDSATLATTTSGLRPTASPAASLAPSLKTKTDGSSTSETAIASSKPRKSRDTRKLGVAGSLTRRLSTRRSEQAAESSADEAEFKRSGSRKLRSRSADLLQAPLPNQSLSQTVFDGTNPSGCNTVDAPASASVIALNSDRASWGQSESDAERSKSVDRARNGLKEESMPLEIDRGIWAGLSKRLSRDFKVSKVPFPSPERKKSTIFRRSETPQALESASSIPAEGHNDVVDREENSNAPQALGKKHKRPLSLSGFLSRSSTFLDGSRSRSSTASSGVAPTTGPLSASLAGSFSASCGTNSASTSGYKRPAGFLHRSTASSGNIPTARALLGISGVQYATLGSGIGRTNEAEPQSAPALQHRRSFNPMWRSPPTVPEERPASSLSLLSETSTVRPLSILPHHMTIATRHELTSQDNAMNAGAPISKLRPRHLPSLSWTLNPGLRAGALESNPRKVPHSLLHRSLTESPQGPAPEPQRHASYFEVTGSSNTSITHSRATTPGARSASSQGTGDSPASIVRRVSLSDLRIPQRISNAQAKIGQDLKRVKEFRDGVEELKRLRRIYKSLVATERTPDTSVSPTSPGQADEEDVLESGDRAELSPSPPPLPAETSARVDHILARVAFDYQEWWEIADVLINLADGAEENDPVSPARERCHSEIVRSSPTIAHRELGSQISVQKNECHSGQPDRAAEGNPTTDSTLPLLASNLRSTPVARALPMLSRSYSTSSFSPSPVTQRQQAREPQEQSFASASCMPCSGSREVIGIEGNTTSLSERQLEILRGMLKPTTSRSVSGSHGRALATTTATAPSTPSRSSASISSSPAPSFTAGWGTGSDSVSWKSESQMQAHFSPLSPLSSRERQLGNGQIHASASYTSLKRKASMKVGSVLVSARDEVEPRASTSADDIHTPRETSPFHISNMLPLPRSVESPTTHAAARVPLIRRTTTTIKPASPLTSRSKELAHSTSSIATAAVGTASPAPMARKGRLRQASRAGMMGIRDFLKALNSSTTSRRSPMNSSLGSITLEDHHGLEDSSTATDADVPQDPSMADEDPNAVEVLRDDDTHALMQTGEDRLGEYASANTTCGSGSAGTSSSDEDWDRHSSDEAESKSSHAPPVDARQSRPLVHRRPLPRSDTEMTVMPTSTPAMHASLSVLLDREAGIAHSTPAKQAVGQKKADLRLSPTMPSSLKVGVPRHAIPLLRSRTYSTNSTTTLGTIQGSFRGVAQTPSHHQISQTRSRSPAAQNTTTADRDAELSVGGRTGIALGTKLVMTSEAMPTLLAKITEVKQHCATCVTELRNVTV